MDSDIVATRIATKYIQQYLDDRNGQEDPRDHIRIEPLHGKGVEVLEDLCDNTDHLFDLVFLDANKKGYIEYMKLLMGESEDGDKKRAMLSPNALIIVDNTLWKGMVVQEVPALADLPEHEEQGGGRMRQLARALHAFSSHCRGHPLLSPVLLPIRDGLTIVRYTP